MFVAIVDVNIKKDKISEFKEWFNSSNRVVEKFDGFISRRLLESQDGAHKILVEFKDKQTFVNMHQSPEHAKLHEQVGDFMENPPTRKTFDVISS